MKTTLLAAIALLASFVRGQAQLELLFSLLDGAACALDCYLDTCDSVSVQCFCEQSPTLQTCFQSSCDSSILVLLTKGLDTFAVRYSITISADIQTDNNNTVNATSTATNTTISRTSLSYSNVTTFPTTSGRNTSHLSIGNATNMVTVTTTVTALVNVNNPISTQTRSAAHKSKDIGTGIRVGLLVTVFLFYALCV